MIDSCDIILVEKSLLISIVLLEMNNELVKLTNVSRNYASKNGSFRALNNVNITINSGEYVAITGASGSGKSTLLHIIGGLDDPTLGDVTIDGKKLVGMSDNDKSKLRNTTMGFVFQSFYLQPYLSVLDNILLPTAFTRCNKKDVEQMAKLLSEELHINDKLDSLPAQLSGGQTQRVAIARAMINRPKIILADEPTGNLDSKNGKITVGILERMNRELSTTLVIVTHDMDIAKRAKRIIVMSDGAIVKDLRRE